MKRILLTCALLGTPMITPALLSAQATGTAHQRIRLQVYGLGSYVRPDFGGALKNAGATVGATANVFSFGNLELGLDVRAVGSGGRVSKQYFYGAGPRVQADLGRLQPFAAFHIGYGKLVFQYVAVPGYTYDDSLVKAFNGGLDYRLSRSWALRGEVERQSWEFNQSAPGFHPLAISAGVRYQFHFHNPQGPE